MIFQVKEPHFWNDSYGKIKYSKKNHRSDRKLSQKAPLKLKSTNDSFEEKLKPLTKDDLPKYPVGQIIFDINGEYANKNLQDGTAIFEKYKDKTLRYSILRKEEADFKTMKVNFYQDITTGFEYLLQYLDDEKGDYLTGFKVSVLNVQKKMTIVVGENIISTNQYIFVVQIKQGLKRIKKQN